MVKNKIPFLHSISTKLFLIYGFISIVITLIFTVLIFENQTDLISENAFLSSLYTGLEMKSRIEQLSFNSDFSPEMDHFVRENNEYDIISLKVFSEDSEVIFSRGKDSSLNTSIEDQKAINTAVTKWEFEKRSFHHLIDIPGRNLDLFIPFYFSQNELGIFKISYSLNQIDFKMTLLHRQALLVAVLVIFNLVIFAIYGYLQLLGPIGSLISASQAVAIGDFDDVQFPERNDEIGMLNQAFRKMSLELQILHENARSANPLTGLPGNVVIERLIRGKIGSNETYCVLYCDLDNFKAYNDIYGFAKGDEVLLYTRDILKKSFKQAGMTDYFLGHQGGDDYVIICSYHQWEIYASTCVTLFDQDISCFYSGKDRQTGFIQTKDRNGKLAEFPLVSISIAAVSNKYQEFSNFGEVVELAAEMKKFVKSKEGSAYAIDRRVRPIRQKELINA